ncbi:GcrA family cell cycle regulator [Hyphomicrobium sp.]|uniref:GcrA family cell cycle regulator n=1 Tax=Hyphomicrobium sp. TaxID=82 RepID=UPI001D33ED64|nr:GcrA family cell cycle regulator [Hyphomicrobium sp.]MBY0560151.1 GcrA family cell cycle regulator [Hyphomicrobium sp.]
MTTYHWHGCRVTTEKVKAIAAVYEPGMGPEGLAKALTSLLGEKVSRSAVIGFYNRSQDLLAHYPLKGRNLKKARENDDMRVTITQGRIVKAERWSMLTDDTPLPSSPLPIRTAATIAPPDERDAGSKKKRLADLKSKECRWPTHEDLDGHMFCAHRTAVGKSYCEDHQKRNRFKGREAGVQSIAKDAVNAEA